MYIIKYIVLSSAVLKIPEESPFEVNQDIILAHFIIKSHFSVIKDLHFISIYKKLLR